MKSAVGAILRVFNNLHELKAIHPYALKINEMIVLIGRLILCGKDMYNYYRAIPRLASIRPNGLEQNVKQLVF
ncbi:hypothetical protein WJU16_00675 [Chitinophaga pollutisoli]|uniref:Uncharacterized protein n=1 Tax=Chitinophaga pollutisoli TaxID=3133966 RepID=A0ABZ2YP88_9BACT